MLVQSLHCADVYLDLVLVKGNHKLHSNIMLPYFICTLHQQCTTHLVKWDESIGYGHQIMTCKALYQSCLGAKDNTQRAFWRSN